MSKPRVLIVGASIAGPTAAYWLVRAGYDVTMVERAPALREGGNGIDIREQALTVVEKMGLLQRVRELAEGPLGMRFVDQGDRVVAQLGMGAMKSALGTENYEVSRGTLSHLIHDQTHNDVDYWFGDSITGLDQDETGIDVQFEHHPDHRFDLVIGADGLHSSVRRLAFGPEASFLDFKQHYFAFATTSQSFSEKGWTTFYNVPGKSVSTYQSADGSSLVNFIFRSDEPLAYNYRDIEQQRRMLRKAYGGLGWHVPVLLDSADADPNFYLDSLSQVKLPSWSSGRVVLLGDAGACASPASGAGALLALIGAYRLAGALSAEPNPVVAFQRYEAEHRALVAKKQAGLFTGISVPKTQLGIWGRNLLVGSPLLGLMMGRQKGSNEPLPDYNFSAAMRQ